MRTKSQFVDVWCSLKSPRRCFIDRNGIAQAWTGDESRFGDIPGRGFGFHNTYHSLDGDDCLEEFDVNGLSMSNIDIDVKASELEEDYGYTIVYVDYWAAVVYYYRKGE